MTPENIVTVACIVIMLIVLIINSIHYENTKHPFNGMGDKNNSINQCIPKFEVIKVEKVNTQNLSDKVCKYILSNSHFREDNKGWTYRDYILYAPQGKYQVGDVLTLEPFQYKNN